MKKLRLIPLILCLFLVGPSCKKSQEESMTKMEKKVEKKIEKKSIDESEALKGPSPRMRKGGGFIQRFDKNNDGKVSKEEFTGLDKVFNRYDKNQDGYIDKSEDSKGLPPRMRKGE